MMVFRQDYLYWKTIQHLVVNHQFRMVQLSQNENEVWLESSKRSGPALVRILRYDLDWGNWLQRDMEQTWARVEEVRKKQYKRKIEAINLYVSTYPPVDEWEERVEKPLTVGNQEKTSMNTIVLHSENISQGLEEFSKHLRIDPPLYDEGILFDYTRVDAIKFNTLTVVNERAKQEKKIFTYGKPYFTYFFIFVQLTMYFFLEMNGGSTNPQTLIKFGAKDNLKILHGEWWRFITPVVLHIGFFHLVMNTLALYFLGTAVERIYGRSRFLVIYLFAGFAGTVASFVFSPAISAGASGAIFGCFGALLFFGVAHPSLFFRTMGVNVIAVIGLNLVIGFIFPVVDNAGHIGGLIGGFLASSILHLPNQRKVGQRVIALIVTIALTLMMLYIGFMIQPTTNTPLHAINMAKTYIEDEKIEEAYERLLHSETHHDNIPIELYFYLSYTEVKLGKMEDARKHLEIVTNERPEFHEAHYNLSLVYIHLKDLEKAKTSIENALAHAPDNDDYQTLLHEINRSLEGSE